MKIAYDPQIFCLQIYGGVSRYFCELASVVSKSSLIDIKIIAPFSINKYLDSIDGKLIWGFSSPRIRSLKNIFRLIGIFLGHLYLLLFNPKIIHETYYFPYALGPKNAKRVLTIYDMIHEKFPVDNLLLDRTSYYKSLAVSRADHIICISEATKKDLIELLEVDERKITVIYLGYFFKKIIINEHKILCMQQIPSNFLLYVGQREGHKNFKNFVSAYSLSEKIHKKYNILCFGGEVFNADELNFFGEKGIAKENFLQLSGNDETLAFLYQRAAALVYPSLYEGFGIPPLEAMNYDCPVICSRAGSIPEVVGEAGEYFNPENIEEMKTSIENVLFIPARRLELVNLGRERITLFSWERCATETMKVYHQVISCEHL
jgi:glycosyltransferase involved in cell wall biosynthesis